MDQTKKRIYSDLYDYYIQHKNYKLALFIKKYFFEGIRDNTKLKEELGIIGDRTIRYRKARISKDLIKLKIITNGKFKDFR